MTSVKDQFTSRIIPDFFEPDSHIDTDQLEIDRIHILSGASSNEDIIAVCYKSSPNISFYNVEGNLLDVDHYLPDFYKEQDSVTALKVIENLKNINPNTIRAKRSFAKLLRETYEAGNDKLALGLIKKFGLETSVDTVEKLKETLGFSGTDLEFKDKLESYYPSFRDFLVALILHQQGSLNRHVHFTHQDNIIITTLNKGSGVAVLIETQDVNGDLLPPNKWNIVRTKSAEELSRILVFRSPDIRAFFESDGYESSYVTQRYVLHDLINKVEIDSRLDETDNLLKLDVVNECIQTLISDENIIVVLSNENEVTIVNSNNSVVPKKWPKKIVIPSETIWMQADENLTMLFAMNVDHELIVYDISQAHAEEIERLGVFNVGFKITQHGDLIVRSLADNSLKFIKTNANDIIPEDNNQNLTKIFADLSHLFKGENIFTRTRYALDITKVETGKKEKEEQIPSAIEVAKHEFESNIESMLASSKSEYETLLDIQNKISIARQNITDELSFKASEEGINLVGQRLKKTINSIVKPSETRVQKMLETLRAEKIMEEMHSIDQKIEQMEDPSEYKDLLNKVRAFEEEIQVMSIDAKSKFYPEFKTIQKQLDEIFAEQISDDGNALFTFLNGEIEQVEKAIEETYDLRQLELLMSTHPAALELLDIIKQPFVLQTFAKGNTLSPAGIQKRLFLAVEQRKSELMAEEERKKEEAHAARIQFVSMIKEAIVHFVNNHTGGFSDLELKSSAAYKQIQKDVSKLETSFADLRTAIDLRRKLEQLILEKSRSRLERMVAVEGKYAYVQNDPDLFIDMDNANMSFPKWSLELIEKSEGSYWVTFIRDSDLEMYRPSTTDNLRAKKSFEILEDEYQEFFEHYDAYKSREDYGLVHAIWAVSENKNEASEFPQFNQNEINEALPKSSVARKALRCCLELSKRDHEERNRERAVPSIALDFIDETPFFQAKLKEFLIKAKLQLMSGSGILLLTGPPSTGKSAFLKFAAALMNREYFEHASDKWQTKNSLVTAIKFGENGPYSVPAGFTKAITTPYSLVNIEEIKEWPEALRKSLNPFFAGSKFFIAPDGTRYRIGENILLCAATNLGSMYRQDDEPFTSDFWSRIEVVEYNYADEEVSRDYLKSLESPKKSNLITIQDVVRDNFKLHLAPSKPKEKAAYIAQQLIEFTLLPKADESIKRENLHNHIQNFFTNAPKNPSKNSSAVKVSLKRLPDLQGYTALEFFDLYDHYVNGDNLRSSKLSRMQVSNTKRYTQLKVIFLCLRYIEGCLRKLREIFYATAGQSEIEGTNREFIKCVYLLGLIGKLK